MKNNNSNTKPLIYDLIAINKITHKYPLNSVQYNCFILVILVSFLNQLREAYTI